MEENDVSKRQWKRMTTLRGGHAGASKPSISIEQVRLDPREQFEQQAVKCSRRDASPRLRAEAGVDMLLLKGDVVGR